MAGLAGNPSLISAAKQFRAIGYLRWRLFANGFRRKGGVGEVVARVIIYPIAFGFLLGPTIAAGVGAWAAVSNGRVQVVELIFWGITVLQILVSINISAPGLSFDPESLIRFPVTFPRYLVVRLFLGLLSASTIVGTCALFSAAFGVTVAQPTLGLIAFASALLLAVANMLFIRMIFAWIDRWLSTRRAREFFTGFVILISVGFQYLNVTFNSGFNRRDPAAQRRKVATAMHFYHSSHAVLAHFPAGLAGASIQNVVHGAWPYALANLFALSLFAALFLAVFAWRMQREYRGENLSDSALSPTAPAKLLSVPPQVPAVATRSQAVSSVRPKKPGPSLPPALEACLYKEWIYVRRNTAQLYGILGPLAMLFIFAGRVGTQFARSGWTFPIGVCYATLGIAALAYNSFGLDAAGVQFYFLAPVRLHTVLLAKNLFNFSIALLEAAIVYIVLCFVSVRPPLLITLATVCWLVFAVFVNVAIGNMRSITAPKKMDPGKLSRRQASQLSALLSLGVLVLLGALGAGVLFLAVYFNLPWMPALVFFILLIAAFALYVAGLNRLDALALAHRETMVEELCKAQ